MAITPTSPNRASMLSLCFPKEIIDDGVIVDPIEVIDGVVPHDEYRDEMDMMIVHQITSIVQLQPVSPFDMFGVSTIEGTVILIEGASYLVDPPLSFDVLSGFVSRFNDVSVASFMDLRDVETIDFDTEDQPRELKIGSPLSTDERERLIHLLRSYLDVFAWSYEDMPGLDPSIVKEEIQKQLSVRFISVLEYPEWLATVVPVPKKDGKVRVCVDFRNLNKASPKDDFPLPHIDLDVEVYVDDMIVKSQGKADHLEVLERFFERIQKFRLSERGIEVNPNKIKVILDIPVSKTKKDIRGFLGRLQYISRFIARLTNILPPTPGRPLLYLSISDMALGCMLAQIDDSRKERVIYYLNEEFVAMTSLSGWCMYFNGTVNQSGYGIGVLLVSPHGDHIPRPIRLTFSDRHPIMNNIIQGDWKTRDVKLTSYHAYLELLVARFDDLRNVHLPRAQNRFANALATLASSVDMPIDVVVRPLLIEWRFAPAYCCLIGEIEVQDDLPWYHDIYQFLRFGTYPEVATTKDRKALRHLDTRFVIYRDTLYRQSADGMLLLCLD
ncbi:hypothetical protein CK203_105890 [Vitis vinifera]|uniref:Reverse transcriptase/retrotransposon-derived protein RNase H-like domain-containing protein n=1 Tax=Vitis vinifera TaxID=29760 RepID=A0A438EI93_VITVI|nr:hypothetical protein CK203_105890 [Vitis vinifera]